MSRRETTLNKQKAFYRCLLFVILVAQPIFSIGQVNYVLNPSFELYSRCPYEPDQIQFANNWSPIDTVNHSAQMDSFGSVNCTPEYCNSCSGANKFAGLPNNENFYQYPRTGNGMAQVYMFGDSTIVPIGYPYLRDYLQGKLFKPLTAGKSYCVSFYVNLEETSKYAVDHIGAYFDGGKIDSSTANYCGLPHTHDIPQVFTTEVISDTMNWVKVEGSFIAKGTEKFITIGNFFDQAHTTYVQIPGLPTAVALAYYLVDDVSVVESDIPAYAGPTVFKSKTDTAFVGRNEIAPGCVWYRNGILVDTMHAGFKIYDTVDCTYVVEQTICGVTKKDTVQVYIVPEGVSQSPTLGTGLQSYMLHPNPSNGNITIQQKVLDNNSVSASIWNEQGQRIYDGSLQFTNLRCQLNLKDIMPGVYLLQLRDSKGKSYSLKFTVING